MTAWNKKHNHEHEHVPPPDLKEIRRQNMARYGTLTVPEPTAATPEEIAHGLAMCLSAGLPEPVDVEGVTYVFTHFRLPGLQFRCPVDDVAINWERVIQVCKNAGIRADQVPALDDPPIEEEAA